MFRDRFDAGELLAKKLGKYADAGKDTIVLGIPRGGVPVAYQIAKKLKAVLDVIIPRKLPIPWSPEVGFGAVTSSGDVVLNQQIMDELDLSESEINEIVERVKTEIDRRMEAYRGNKPLPKLKNKTVIIVDDGFATGYTMIAALQSVRKQKPKKLIAAAPVSPQDSVNRIKPYADEVVTLWAKPTYNFAVAQFYEDFHDMKDAEVTELLNEF
jgi:putative phosphoribosyl transferase